MNQASSSAPPGGTTPDASSIGLPAAVPQIAAAALSRQPPGAERSSQSVTRAYERLLLTLFAISPALPVAYVAIYLSGGPSLELHLFHEIAITVSIVESAFIAAVTWICYRSSGERLLFWLALGFAGFALIYAPHGLLTPLAHSHLALFLIYGPISRLFMTVCLFIGLRRYGKPARPPTLHKAWLIWATWLVGFLLLDLAVAIIALSRYGEGHFVKRAIESTALLIELVTVAVLLKARYQSPLMLIYAISVSFFAIASVAFLLAAPWNHQWWLAHLISAAGFLLLSYGVIRAYHTTRSFSQTYSAEEWVEQLADAKNAAEQTLHKLRVAHEELQHIAITDALTGISNRRYFITRAEAEIARARRQGTPLALLILDIDHFKQLNDRHGHLAGDEALRQFAAQIRQTLRPGNIFGRIGGEEFAVVVTDATLEQGIAAAERIRSTIETLIIHHGTLSIQITVSIGVAALDSDTIDLTALLAAADNRLYSAKAAGRNRVSAVVEPRFGVSGGKAKTP